MDSDSATSREDHNSSGAEQSGSGEIQPRHTCACTAPIVAETLPSNSEIESDDEDAFELEEDDTDEEWESYSRGADDDDGQNVSNPPANPIEDYFSQPIPFSDIDPQLWQTWFPVTNSALPDQAAFETTYSDTFWPTGSFLPQIHSDPFGATDGQPWYNPTQNSETPFPWETYGPQLTSEDLVLLGVVNIQN